LQIVDLFGQGLAKTFARLKNPQPVAALKEGEHEPCEKLGDGVKKATLQPRAGQKRWIDLRQVKNQGAS
jgi:hypothetical protein